MKRRETGCNLFGGPILALGFVLAAAGAGHGNGVAGPRCGSAAPAIQTSQDRIHGESRSSIRQRDALPGEAIGDWAPSFDRLDRASPALPGRSKERIVLPDSTPNASAAFTVCLL